MGTHKFGRLLSSTCGTEMEKKMISAVAVAILQEAACSSKPADAKAPCAAFTRVAHGWEEELSPPCKGNDLKCTKDGDSICIHPVCKADIAAIPANERPT